MPRRGTLLLDVAVSQGAHSTIRDLSSQFGYLLQGAMAASFATAAAEIVNQFQGQINEIVENANQVIQGARHQRLQNLTPEQEGQLADIIDRSSVDRSAAEAAFGTLRAFTGLETAEEIVDVGTAFARYEAVGGDSEQLAALIRRSHGRDVGAEQILADANLFPAIAASYGRDAPEVVENTAQYGTSFEIAGYTNYQAAAFFGDAAAAGYDPTKFGDLIARAPANAGGLGISAQELLGALEQQVRAAETSDEAAAIINTLLPGGFSQVPRVDLAQYIRRGGTLFPSIFGDVRRDPGLSIVSGTPAEQLQAAIDASVIRGSTENLSFQEQATGVAASSLVDIRNIAPGVAGLVSGGRLGDAEVVGAGLATAQGLPLIGEGVTRSLREQYEFPEGSPIGSQPIILQIIANNQNNEPVLSPEVVDQINEIIEQSQRGSGRRSGGARF